MSTTAMEKAVSLLLFYLISIANGQLIKITDQSYPVEKAVNLQTITWRWPVATPIYCVSDTTVTNLRFSCPNCNASSSQAEQQFMSDLLKADDQSSNAGFTVIRIQQFRVDPLLQGKILRCEGSSSGQRQANSPSQQPINIQVQPAAGRQNGRFSATGYDQLGDTTNGPRAEAEIKILFLNHPTILNMNGNGPVFKPNEGNKFFVKDQEQMQLKCMSDGNPQPNKYEWTQDGAVFAQGQTTTVSATLHMGASILCKSYSSEFLDGMASDAVGISMSVTPKLNRTNFSQQQRPSGIDQDGKAKIGSQIQLECSFTASPAPEIRFVQTVNTGQLGFANVTCQEGPNSGTPTQTFVQNLLVPLYSVSSRCTVQISNYSAAGQYSCQGCINITDGPGDCYPKANQFGSNYIEVNVIGKPMAADIQPPPVNTSNGVWIPAWYCADPKPTKVSWQVGSTTVPTDGSTVGNYKSTLPKPNGTSTDCYEVILKIEPMTSADSNANIVLTVENSLGTMTQPFKAIVVDRPTNEKKVNLGLAIGLPIGLLVLAVIIGLTLCWFFGWLCCADFGRNKPKSETYRKNVPSGIDDIKPAPVPTRPAPMPRQSPPRNPPVTRIPAPNGHNDSFGNSSVHSEITDSSSYIPYKTDSERRPLGKPLRNGYGRSDPSSQESGSEAFEPNEYANLLAQTYNNRFATRSPTSV